MIEMKNIAYKFAAVMMFVAGLASCSDDPESLDSDIVIAGEGDLTPDMIWCDGTRWTEAYVVDYFDGGADPESTTAKTGYAFIEYKLKSTRIKGTDYLRVWAKYPYDESVLDPVNEFMRLSGNKVYGLDTETGKEIVFQDFSTWIDGGLIVINYLSSGEPETLQAGRFSRLTYDGTLPYALYGDGGEAGFVRYIGRIHKPGLSGYWSSMRSGTETGTQRLHGEATIVEIVSGKTGETVFRHPDRDGILSKRVPFIPDGLSMSIDRSHYRQAVTISVLTGLKVRRMRFSVISGGRVPRRCGP